MKRIIKEHLNKVLIVFSALVLGFFIVVQLRSFENVNEIIFRDQESNVFQEIQILKDKNDNLLDEIAELENTISQLTNQNSALEAIDDEIAKYKKLTGDFPVFGPGITVTLDGGISTAWVIDLINEFFNSGAQAVAVNGIRITNKTLGFDTLPQGQILLNGSILSSPYTFDVIGESEVLMKVLDLPGGIFERLQSNFPGLEISMVRKEVIQMK